MKHKVFIFFIFFLLLTKLSAQNIPTNETGPSAATYKMNLPVYNLKKADDYHRVYTALIPIQDTALLNMSAATTDVAVVTQYFDQLVRPLQTVAKQASPAGKDVVSPTIYDSYGRMPVQYLPYTNGTNGKFKPEALKEDSAFYESLFPNEDVIYAETIFEPSPLGRVTNQYAPGNSWGGAHKGITITTRANALSDSVRLWQINITGENDVPYTSLVYAALSLSVKDITDEQGNRTIIYTDEHGRKILTKTMAAQTPSTHHSGWLCTYYVYDETGHLRTIIPPKAVNAISGSNFWNLATSSTTFQNLCYSYWYDNRGRLLAKQIPGKGKTYFAHDKLDRLVMSQDEKLRLTNQWNFIKYDGQSRPCKTGLITTTLTKDQVQANAATSADYPVLTGTYTLLTETYFDNYNWTSGTPLNNTLVTTHINSSNFITGYNTAPYYAQSIAVSARIRGKITGSKTMVLGSSTYLYTLSLYDEEGRNVQTKQTNYSGGTDIATVQYNFSSKLLRTHLSHQKSSAGNQTHTLLTKYNYDNGGRLQELVKNIDNLGDKTISALAYNELGQVKTKTLGDGLSIQSYNYNIRGWLSAINKTYVESASGAPGASGKWFGEILNYDYGFTAKQYSGNIAGVKWKAAGDGVARAFGYGYDPANRLAAADFSQQNNGSTAWTKDKMDFTVGGIAYDVNGNITSMTQRGMKINAPVIIDSLTYTYLTSSNQLSKIKDFIAATDPWGDFKDTSLATDDYAYDVNGNIVKDNNKHIHGSSGTDGIAYNFLDKPANITVNGRGSIAYVYDAGGVLLQKTANDAKAGLKTITTFLAGFVYERRMPIAASGGTDTLQFVLHEEGRIRNSIKTNMQTGAISISLQYDYFLKDHLGNIRTTLTEEQRADAYPVASLENATLASEKIYYFNLDGGRTDKALVPGYPSDTYTNPNNFTQKLNGGVVKTGASILLKVMAGDTITARVNSWYKNVAAPQTPVSPLTDIINALTNSLPVASGTKVVQAQLGGSVLNPSVIGFLNSRDAGGAGTRPKAWFNVVLLDEQLNPVITTDGKNSFFKQAGSSGAFETHSITNRVMSKSGYVYIYVSNETPNIDVYFDNLQVTHKRGALLGESAYYPFGLEMQAISSQAAIATANEYKFNAGTLLEERFDIDLYETPFRRYDAQIGRFTGMDALAELASDLTPYQFGFNNPISYNDPTGLWSNLDASQGRSKKGADGNYHADWYSELTWNSVGFFDWGLAFGNGNGFSEGTRGGHGSASGHYSNIMGMTSGQFLQKLERSRSGDAADFITQLVKASKNGIFDIFDENGNSVQEVNWKFNNGTAISMATRLNSNSFNYYNAEGKWNITVNENNIHYVSEIRQIGPKILGSQTYSALIKKAASPWNGYEVGFDYSIGNRKNVEAYDWYSGLYGFTAGVGWEQKSAYINSQTDGTFSFTVIGVQIYYFFVDNFIELGRQNVEIKGYFNTNTHAGEINSIKNY